MGFEIDNAFGILIANVRNHLKNSLEKELMEHGVSPAQSIILRRLCEKDNLNQKELAKDTFFKQPSLTRLIDKLEENGLVERRAKKNDRRAYLICITPKGRKLKNILIEANDKIEKKALEGIDENTKAILINNLKKIYTNLK